jgi:hypothetical protein
MQAFIETAKMVIRLAVFAAISAFLVSISDSVTKLPQSQTTVILGFVLAGVDKWIHENESIPMKGLWFF